MSLRTLSAGFLISAVLGILFVWWWAGDFNAEPTKQSRTVPPRNVSGYVSSGGASRSMGSSASVVPATNLMGGNQPPPIRKVELDNIRRDLLTLEDIQSSVPTLDAKATASELFNRNLDAFETLLQEDEIRRANSALLTDDSIAKVWTFTFSKPDTHVQRHYESQKQRLERQTPSGLEAQFRVDAQRLFDNYLSQPKQYRVISLTRGKDNGALAGHLGFQVFDFDDPSLLPQPGKPFNPLVKNDDGTVHPSVTASLVGPYLRADGTPNPRYYRLFQKVLR